MKTLKRAARAGLSSVLAHGAPITWRLRSTPRLLILMYHRVLPQADPARAYEQPGMYVSPQTLAMNIEALQQHFELVHLDDWIATARGGGKLPARACALTFDDGWRDNYDHALPVLRNAAAPATIFLVSQLIAGSYGFWPTRLGRLLSERHRPLPAGNTLVPGGGPLDAIEIDHVITRLKAQHSDEHLAREVQALEASLSAAAARDRDLLDRTEIDAMTATGLIRFGSHTRTHRRLTSDVPAALLRDEIDGSQQELATLLAKPVNLFCYPNGDHCDAATTLVAARYDAAVTTAWGWTEAGSDLHRLPRVGVHEDVASSRSRFIARLAAHI